jgi:hypothetical protein
VLEPNLDWLPNRLSRSLMPDQQPQRPSSTAPGAAFMIGSVRVARTGSIIQRISRPLICFDQEHLAYIPIKHEVPGNRCASCVPNPFIVHYLGRKAHDGFLEYLSKMATLCTRGKSPMVTSVDDHSLRNAALGFACSRRFKSLRKSPPQTTQNK